MTQGKHTPGPWVVSKDSNKVRRIFAGESGPQVATASVFANWMPVERLAEAHATADANARLIAAAPDMLEALQSAQESIATFIGVHGYPSDSGAGDVLQEVSAAIARATGEKP